VSFPNHLIATKSVSFSYYQETTVFYLLLEKLRLFLFLIFK